MADTAVNTGASGAPIRVLTALGAGVADQQVVTLADSAGNLLGTTAAPFPTTLVASGGQTPVAGSITAAGANTPGTAATTSTTGSVVINTAASGNATFHVVAAAFVGTLIFEASVDAGLNYAPVIALREDGTGAESSTAISTASAFIRQYTVALPGLNYFRVRASAFTSGAAAVIIAPGPTLFEPNPSLAASSATIGGVLTPSAARTAQSVTSAVPTAAVAVSGYQGVMLTLTPTAVTAFTAAFQFSDDGGTTWYNTAARAPATTGAAISATTTSTAAGSWWIPVAGATHFRLNVSAFTGTSMAVGVTPTAGTYAAPGGSQVQLSATSSGGATKFRLNSAATTNATSVKATAGSVYGYLVTNTNAAARFLKLYDLAAAPTVGTSVPAMTIQCPAASITSGTTTANFPIPVTFGTGIALATTTLATDVDATAVAAGDLLITLLYV